MKKLIALSFLLAACSGSARIPSSGPSYPITVIGGDESSFTPPEPGTAPQPLGKNYDVVVVGAGLSGLSASIFLSDAGHTVMLLEKEATLGGLAQGTTFPGTDVRFDRGAAYWTDAYEEEQQILNRIGLGDFKTKHPIPEPIDNFFWDKNMYEGIWDEATMDKEPASFRLFFTEIQKENDEKLIPDQPIEEAKNMSLDRLSAKEWIRSMPASLAKRRDKDSIAAYKRFKEELASGRLDKNEPMAGVLALMDLYCRSALGTTSDAVSAIAFANFYISEITTRYTTQIGTGQAAENMAKLLASRPNVSLNPSSPVVKITNQLDGVEVQYVNDGKLMSVRAKYVVYAAQLKFAPKIIEHFAEDAPEQASLMAGMQYANYSVHAVEVKGHPYRGSYDTWTWQPSSTVEDFTDVILGRWLDPTIEGYNGYRDYKADPPGNAIMTIYHPLPLSKTGQGYTDEQAKSIAHYAVDRMLELYNPMLQERYHTQFDVLSVQTSRWPFSVHVAVPGHFSKKVKIMRRPFGRVYFGNNNLGTPAFEEALFRGHCAAANVLTHLEPSYKKEKWSRCAIEK
jgi:phytoene dehydrogenase-like protein